MKLADFFVQIGVDADSLKVKDLAKAVGNIPLEVAGAVAALAGLEFGIAKLAGEAMSVAVGFEAFHNQTGLSAQELQKWQVVAAQANVSAEAMNSSVVGLQKNLAEIKLGRGNLQPFLMMGVNPRDNAFGVLSQIRKRLPGMDRTMATNLISQMGLSPEMMNVLTLSSRKFEEFGRRVRGMSAEDEQAFLKSKLALTQLGLEFKDFSFSHLAPLAGNFAELLSSLNNMKIVLPAIGTAAAALGLAFAPMTTAIVALIGLMDDLVAYKEGRNSLFGTIFGGIKNYQAPPGSGISSQDAVGAAIGNGLADRVLGALGLPKDKTIFAGLAEILEKKSAAVVNISVDGSEEPHRVAQVVGEHVQRIVGRAGTQTSGKQDRR